MRVDQTPLEAAMKFAQEPRAYVNMNARIGLAWMTTKQGIVWRDGGTGGYRSFLGFTVDRKRSVVILTKTAAQVDDLGVATLLANAALVNGGKEVTLSSAELDAYAGSYKLADTVLKLARTGDKLYGWTPGLGTFQSSARHGKPVRTLTLEALRGVPARQGSAETKGSAAGEGLSQIHLRRFKLS